MTIGKSRNATFGGNTILQDDDKVGGLLFVANDGTDFQSNIGRITAEVDDSSPAENEIGGRLVFSTSATDSGNVSERMRIDSAGDVTFTGDLIMADGKGIDFSANTDDYAGSGGATGETLTDYEEGTWVWTAVGSNSGSWTPRSGYTLMAYTKIGRVVHFQGRLETTGAGSSPDGMVRISLPFTSVNLSDLAGQSKVNVAFWAHGGTITSNAVGIIVEGNAYFYLAFMADDGTFTHITDSVTDTAWEALVSGSYIAA
jgi:hypothetical protein